MLSSSFCSCRGTTTEERDDTINMDGINKFTSFTSSQTEKSPVGERFCNLSPDYSRKTCTYASKKRGCGEGGGAKCE